MPHLRCRCIAGVIVLAILSPFAAAEPKSPEFPAAQAWSGRSTVVLPSGQWHRFAVRRTDEKSQLVWFESDDEGISWSEPYVATDLPGEGWGGAAALRDRRGEVQVFITRTRREGEGNVPAVNRFIDVWHLRSADGRKDWEPPKRIFEGYTGAISPAVQLKSGRLLLPIGMWIAGRTRGAPTGTHDVSGFYSDDDGATFTLSPSRLVAPVSDDYNGDKVGACEPCAVELADGRVLMHMRTQDGWLYESISTDGGANWPDARASALHSSTGPPSLIRLPDGRIVLFWNNCAMPPKVDGQGVYGGRDALHAAIADPAVTTWRGLREVYRDPTRNLEPPKRGDRGTAYPESLPTRDGRIAVVSGQGGRRALFYVDPEWLLETRRADDFSQGLDGWCVYKAFGPASGWWRNRTQGATLIDHPDKPGAKALHLRRPDEKAADGATWNFPSGTAGALKLRFMLRPESAGGSVALTDCFYDPSDDAGESAAMFRLPIGVGAKLGEQSLSAGRWYDLALSWDLEKQTCEVTVDGTPALDLPLANPTRTGVSYLRLRSTADTVDPAGWLVERVEAEVATSE